MAEDHLQLHRHPHDNGEEANGSMVGGDRSWLQLEEPVTQEDSQGKDLRSKLIQ